MYKCFRCAVIAIVLLAIKPEVFAQGVNSAPGVTGSPSTAGTVSSVTFTGDGTILSSTPSAPVTSSGTVAATAANIAGNKWIGNPTVGSAALGANFIGTSDTTPNFYALDTGVGGANVYNVNPTPAVTALSTGVLVGFKVANGSTAASTINVSSLGVKNLQKAISTGLAALVTGDLNTTDLYFAWYDGTQWELLNPSTVMYAASTPLVAGALVQGNGTNTAQTNSNITLAAGGTFNKYNNESATGLGVPFMRGTTSQKSETAADANVLTVTPASTVGVYRACFTESVSAAVAATLGWTATYTDSNGNAQTPTNLSLFQTGVAAPALTFTTSAAANYYNCVNLDVNNAGTNIVIKTTFAGTSFTAKVSASLERISN